MRRSGEAKAYVYLGLGLLGGMMLCGLLALMFVFPGRTMGRGGSVSDVDCMMYLAQRQAQGGVVGGKIVPDGSDTYLACSMLAAQRASGLR